MLAFSFVGQIPRLSKVNLFTLLSLWMELFPGVEAQGQKSQVYLISIESVYPWKSSSLSLVSLANCSPNSQMQQEPRNGVMAFVCCACNHSELAHISSLKSYF